MSHVARKTCCAAAGMMALSIVAGGCETSPAATAPSGAQASISSLAAARRGVPAMSVDVCHRTQGVRPFIRITVDDSALQAHLDHGDGVPGQPVPGQPGVFGSDCQVETAAQCPCWAGLTELQLVALLTSELGTQQADCATFGGEVFARGVNGNSTEFSAIQADMSCSLVTGAVHVSAASLPAAAFAACLSQAQQIVPQLSACND